MKKAIKRLTVGMIIGTMLVSLLTGCGKGKDENATGGNASETNATAGEATASGDEVVKIGDYKISKTEAMVYIIQQMYSHGVTTENVDSLAETCKKEAISNLRETYIIYDVAMHNDIEVTDEDKEKSDEYADNFNSAFGKALDNLGISEQDVKEVFYKQMVVAKFENDMQNKMGKDINDDVNDQYKDVRFVDLYQFLFPTIEAGEDGNPKTDEDGNYIKLSDEEKQEIYAKATEAMNEAKGTEKPEDIAEEYGVSDYSLATTGYIGGFTEDYNAMIEKMNDGDVTDVFETDKGYVFYLMVNRDDEDLRNAYTYTMATQTLKTSYEDLRTSWLQTIEIDEEGDLIGTGWADISVKDIVETLKDAGIIMPSESSQTN